VKQRLRAPEYSPSPLEDVVQSVVRELVEAGIERVQQDAEHTEYFDFIRSQPEVKSALSVNEFFPEPEKGLSVAQKFRMLQDKKIVVIPLLPKETQVRHVRRRGMLVISHITQSCSVVMQGMSGQGFHPEDIELYEDQDTGVSEEEPTQAPQEITPVSPEETAQWSQRIRKILGIMKIEDDVLYLEDAGELAVADFPIRRSDIDQFVELMVIELRTMLKEQGISEKLQRNPFAGKKLLASKRLLPDTISIMGSVKPDSVKDIRIRVLPLAKENHPSSLCKLLLVLQFSANITIRRTLGKFKTGEKRYIVVPRVMFVEELLESRRKLSPGLYLSERVMESGIAKDQVSLVSDKDRIPALEKSTKRLQSDVNRLRHR